MELKELVESQAELVAEAQKRALRVCGSPVAFRDMTVSLASCVDKLATLKGLEELS